MKKKQEAFRFNVRRPISITITEYQAECLRRMCVKFGEPGVPLASMASTCFTRGLMVMLNEIPIEAPKLA